MKLRDWRIANNLKLRELADLLGIGDTANPARRAQIIETGETGVSAILAEKIVEVTSGQVSLKDLNDIRRDYLQGTRQTEAAE